MKRITLLLLFVASLVSCSEDDADSKRPSFTSYAPTASFTGEVVIIHGKNFGTSIEDVTVTFYDGADAEVTEVTNSTITVVVPSDAYVGDVTITIGDVTITGDEFIVLTMCPIGPPGEMILIPCNRYKPV